MKFNRDALIKACDDALAADRARWDARLAKDTADHSDAVARWLHDHGQQWADAGLKIRRAVRSGKPVTAQMLPGGRYGSAVFDAGRNLDRTYEPPSELAVLRRVLDTVVDEEIASTGLEKLGIRSRTLRDAAMYMTAGSVRT